MNEQVMSDGSGNEQLYIPLEERLRMAIVGMEHARECGNEQVRKDYEKEVSCLFWVLGRSGSYDYIDGKVILYD